MASKYNDVLGKKLTDREIEIKGLVVQGLSNDEIAEQLCISPKTVKNHISNLFNKLGAKNRIDVIINHYEKRGCNGNANR